VEREGEAFVVVSALPASESFSGRLEVREAVPPPRQEHRIFSPIPQVV
jgi:hypothetical protein